MPCCEEESASTQALQFFLAGMSPNNMELGSEAAQRSNVSLETARSRKFLQLIASWKDDATGCVARQVFNRVIFVILTEKSKERLLKGVGCVDDTTL